MRHGEPTYADTERLGLIGQGAELGQLTAEGIAQAEAAAKDARLSAVDLIVASPYPRALHTAAIVSRRIDRPIEVAAGIFEWLPDVGYADAAKDDLAAAWLEYKRNGGEHRAGDIYKNWETHTQMRRRVIPWLAPYLRREDIGTLLIVCHGGVMRALLDQPSLPKIHYCEIIELTQAQIDAILADAAACAAE